MTDSSLRDQAYKWLHEGADEHREKQKKEQLLTEFANFDCSTLLTMTSKDLAAWQAKYPTDSPQNIVATQEWDRRAHEKQKISTQQAALVGFAGALIGAILTALITWLLSPQKADNNISSQIQSGEHRTQHDMKKKPANIKPSNRQNP